MPELTPVRKTPCVVITLAVARLLSDMLHKADADIEWTDSEEAAWAALTGAIERTRYAVDNGKE